MKEEFTLAVDTDAYAGNFERGMFVFMTGTPYDYEGDGNVHPLCRTALEAGKAALGPDRFDSLLDLRPNDDDDCVIMSFVCILPTPGTAREYNSVGLYLQRRPTDEELATLKERAHLYTTFAPENPKVIGFRLICETITEREEAL